VLEEVEELVELLDSLELVEELVELLDSLELVEELVELLLELRISVELELVLDEQGPTLHRVHFKDGLVCRHTPSGNTRRSGANAT
jgi:hypothetical protein